MCWSGGVCAGPALRRSGGEATRMSARYQSCRFCTGKICSAPDPADDPEGGSTTDYTGSTDGKHSFGDPRTGPEGKGQPRIPLIPPMGKCPIRKLREIPGPKPNCRGRSRSGQPSLPAFGSSADFAKSVVTPQGIRGVLDRSGTVSKRDSLARRARGALNVGAPSAGVAAHSAGPAAVRHGFRSKKGDFGTGDHAWTPPHRIAS